MHSPLTAPSPSKVTSPLTHISSLPTADTIAPVFFSFPSSISFLSFLFVSHNPSDVNRTSPPTLFLIFLVACLNASGVLAVRQLGGAESPGAVTDNTTFSTSLSSLVPGVDIVFVLACTTSVGLESDPLLYIQTMLGAITPETIASEVDGHASFWASFYSQSSISLPSDPLTEKFWSHREHRTYFAASSS
jgi:hypothetical protein